MGALPQTRIEVPVHGLRKPPIVETNSGFDKYGRDPNSASERFRGRTDLDLGTGWAPLYHAVFADLPRLSSGNVCTLLLVLLNTLSLGRKTEAKGGPRHAWTLPVTSAHLAEVIGCSIRAIQIELSELEARGLIALKTTKGLGTVKYSVSLLFSKWRGLENYAVWKRRQAVCIDEPAEVAEDEAAPAEVAKDAVHLTKRPQRIAPGRASRAVPVNVGVSSFRVVNGADVDLIYDPVVSSGCLTFSVAGVVSGAGRGGANEPQFARDRAQVVESTESLPPNEGSSDRKNPTPPNAGSRGIPKTGMVNLEFLRADEIISLFDPLLRSSGAHVISKDKIALAAACRAYGELPSAVLEHWLFNPRNGRAKSKIRKPTDVALIVTEARENWEANHDPLRELREVLAHPKNYSQDDVKAARLKLAELEQS